MTLDLCASDVDEVALLAELRLWVEMETPSADATSVNRLVDRVQVVAEAAGLITERTAGTMGLGDVIVVRSPRMANDNRKGVLVLAHLDTVHAVGTIQDELPWRKAGNSLYGPGIYDMKSGALMALKALTLIVERGLTTKLPVDILFVPDEEIGSISSRPAIEAHARNACFALVMEPARDGGKIVIARKGIATYDIIVRGRAAHAGSRPQDGRSAIRAAAKLVLSLEELNDPARGVTLTVGTIHGGTGRNTVPAECRMQVDVRLPDAEAAGEIDALIHAMTPGYPDISIDIVGGSGRPPFAQSSSGLQLFNFAAEIASGLGIDLKGVSTGAGSDGNFAAALGVPTLDGLGADGAGAHTVEEQVYIDSIASRTALLANLMLKLNTSMDAVAPSELLPVR
jgi:glutamate carboxypeptidase